MIKTYIILLKILAARFNDLSVQDFLITHENFVSCFIFLKPDGQHSP